MKKSASISDGSNIYIALWILAAHIQYLMRYESKSEKNNIKVFYLCDGMVPECEKSNCFYKNTAEGFCKHTSDINHAVNFKSFMEEEMGIGKSSNIKIEQENKKEDVKRMDEISK